VPKKDEKKASKKGKDQAELTELETPELVELNKALESEQATTQARLEVLRDYAHFHLASMRSKATLLY